MLKKYIITYKAAIRFGFEEIEAPSKYAAKKVFYRKHPRCEIISIQEVACESCASEH